MIEIVLIFVGILILFLGSKLVIDSSLFFAEYFNLSKFLIGLFILALGSDIPELVVSIKASLLSLQGGSLANGIVIGNALGSTFSQGSLILGLSSIYASNRISKTANNFHGPMLIGSCLLFFFLYLQDSSISQIDGIILVCFYLFYVFMSYFLEKKKEPEQSSKNVEKSHLFSHFFKYSTLFIVGVFCLHFGSELVLDNVILFCSKHQVSQTVVSFFTIGFGSSLPELTVCLVGAYKGEKSIPLANILGSNIFDSSFVPGIGAIIYPLYAERSSTIFYMVSCIILSLIIFALLGRKRGLQKIEGMILILIFVMVSIINIFIIEPGPLS